MYFRLSFNHFDSTDCSRQRTKYLLFPCFNFLWHFTCRLHIHIFYIALTCFFLCISFFLFCPPFYEAYFITRWAFPLALASCMRPFRYELTSSLCEKPASRLLPSTRNQDEKESAKTNKFLHYTMRRLFVVTVTVAVVVVVGIIVGISSFSWCYFSCFSLSLSEVFFWNIDTK